MDDLPDESLEKYPPAWSDYDWTDYDQDDFDDWIKCRSRNCLKKHSKKR
jgi:hypothetical protein